MARKKKNVLDKLPPSELTSVVRALLSRHPELESEAEAIVIEAMSDPSIEDIAEDVFDAVASLGIDALDGRAGKQPWGYVEPSEAAWELLEESVEDVVADMRRHMDLGLLAAAETICCGIVAGLHRVDGISSDGLLGWAPDFPAEQACHTVAELLRLCPVTSRKATRDRVIEALADLAPDWNEMISRAAGRSRQ